MGLLDLIKSLLKKDEANGSDSQGGKLNKAGIVLPGKVKDLPGSNSKYYFIDVDPTEALLFMNNLKGSADKVKKDETVSGKRILIVIKNRVDIYVSYEADGVWQNDMRLCIR